MLPKIGLAAVGDNSIGKERSLDDNLSIIRMNIPTKISRRTKWYKTSKTVPGMEKEADSFEFVSQIGRNTVKCSFACTTNSPYMDAFC